MLATRRPVLGELINRLLKLWAICQQKLANLYRGSAERCRLDNYADDRQPDEHKRRTGRREHDRALINNQVRGGKRGDNDQRPIKHRKQ